MGRPQRRCESNFHLSSPKIPLPHGCVNSLKPEVHLFSNRTIKKALLASCRQSCFPTISKSLKSLSVQPGPFPKGWVWLYLTAICLGNNLKSHGRHDTHVPSLSQGSRLDLASKNWWGWLHTKQEGIGQGLCNTPLCSQQWKPGASKVLWISGLHLPPHTGQDKLGPAQTCRFPCGKHFSWKGRHFPSLFYNEWPILQYRLGAVLSWFPG